MINPSILEENNSEDLNENNIKDKECHFCGGQGCEECGWSGENLYNDLDENEDNFIL